MKTFSPKHCSVVIYNDHKEDDLLPLSLFISIYKSVVIKHDKTEVIQELRSYHCHHPVLLLIDTGSCMNECPELLSTVVRFIREGLLTNTIPIVCSTLDCPHFMVKCINEGAADYVIKPPSEDVIKTLFLNVARYNMNTIMSQDIQQETCRLAEYGKVWPKFKERLKSVFLQETWLSKIIAEYYTPKPTVHRSSMKSMLEDRKEYLKSQICSWDFLPLDLELKDLVEVVYLILNQVLTSFDELKSLCVPSSDLYHFIFDICNSYHGTNPYHNFRHAVDVLQANYYFLCKMGLLKPMYPSNEFTFGHSQNPVIRLMTPLDIFALLMASIGHDVGHPGVNNNFMITASTPLAIIYNDKSVLESFHAMSFFHLLQDNCFSQLTDLKTYPNYCTFRKIVVNSILATDMSLHDDYVQKINDQAKRIRENAIDTTDNAAIEREKIILCGALIKCADISNCARPFESAKRWAEILAEEFFEQGELEKEFGLNVLPINERGKVSLEDFQLSFKRFIALKLFEAVSSVTEDMQFTVDIIYDNINTWENMKKKQEIDLKFKQDVKTEQHSDMTPNNSISPNQVSSFDSKVSSQQRSSRSGMNP
ncbi:3',5'-cyclic-nucleotide phosphodiesterase [Rhizopus azygosporus]|uniref:Phosphodiesterase n=1 Tax=Rhizopus azygosporus TaxID=86630 RepID=A0A367KAK9_RHIAZ|nr:3',5'-cyclic-nucleotide phosphodiesterase [Rhizopus azygosporus]